MRLIMKKLMTVLISFICWVLAYADCCERDTVTVFMIGDSTMADKPIDGDRQERGWGQMLPGYLTGPVKVENHARNGRSTKSFIDEGRWLKVVDRIRKGDYVFIQFGHNDEKADSTLHTEAWGSFRDNLCRFVTEARAKGGVPVLFNSIVRRNYPPRGMKEHRYVYDSEWDSLVDTHGDYVRVPAEVARELDVPFVDMTAISRAIVSGLGPEKSKELYMWIPKGKYRFCPEGKIDNTHFTVYGAQVMASAALDALVEVLPSFGRYSRKKVMSSLPEYTRRLE